MRIASSPDWLRISKQQKIIFDIIFRAPKHQMVFFRIVEAAQLALPKATKPRVSDLLAALEEKGLISRGVVRGDWAVAADAMKRLAESSQQRASKAKATTKKGKK